MKIVVIAIVSCIGAITFVALVMALISVIKMSKVKVAKKEPDTDSVDDKSDDLKPETDVSFSTDKLTLDQKYLNLPPKYRKFYDEIVSYANKIEGQKRYKTAIYEEYKVGKKRVVKIKIKNGIVICELLVPNLDFNNYVSDNKIDVRQSSTVIKVTDEASLLAVKGSMDIVLNEFQKERDYKKAKSLERRRQRRAMAKSVNTDSVSEDGSTMPKLD